MPIITQNTTGNPMPFTGSGIQFGKPSGYYATYTYPPYLPHLIGSTLIPDNDTNNLLLSQVVGLVPLFKCDSVECREGKYGSDDTNFMLPVFAQNQTSIHGDYFNDTNSFLFNFPSDTSLTHHRFYLDKKINETWQQETELKDNTLGQYYGLGDLCNANAYIGYQLYWNMVLHTYGEGIYRFRVEGSYACDITQSSGYIKITDLGDSLRAVFSVIGYGDLCGAFFFDNTLSLSVNMNNFTNAINTYQLSTYPTPLFHAFFDGTKIVITGLQGQNGIITDNSTFEPNVYLKQDLTGGSNTDCDPQDCYSTPPFCLKTWDCYAVDLTTRFDATYSGGVIGDINKVNAGNLFSFCCTGQPIITTGKTSHTQIFIANCEVSMGTVPDTFYQTETWTFYMSNGFDLVSPITITSGTTYEAAVTQIINAINAYQLTLPTVEFTAAPDPMYNNALIVTNLQGDNIQYTINRGTISSTNYLTVILQSVSYCGYSVMNGNFIDGNNIDPNFVYSNAISWQESIRVGGEFGYEQTDYERKSIKYQTGIVNKIRDEAIFKFTWKSSAMPFWFHERFKGYALMADELQVSDYNLNNADYNLKLYSVQGDSSYNPDYKGYTRYTKVKCDFKSKIQNNKRTRCC